VTSKPTSAGPSAAAPGSQSGPRRIAPAPAHAPATSTPAATPRQQQQQDDAGSASRPRSQAGPGSAGKPTAGGKLPGAAARLAKLHGHLLANGLVTATMEQLQLLVRLLTHPSSTSSRHCAVCQPAGDEGPGPQQAEQVWGPDVLCCPATAARYACRALECSGKLAASLGPRTTELLAECPALRLHAPQLAALLRKQLQQLGLKAQRPCELGAGGAGPGGAPGLIGAPGPLEQVAKGRSVEEQRRAGNREACRCAPARCWPGRPAAAALRGGRSSTLAAAAHLQPAFCAAACLPRRDLLFNSLKEASAYLAGGRAGPGPAPGPGPAQHSAAAAGEALAVLQQRARELLQRLMPQNFSFLAELLVGWLLQAALTGEALMAAEVAALAQRNPGRFQRLNQRLQVGCSRAGSVHAGAAAAGRRG
jgi:hypothetical protein